MAYDNSSLTGDEICDYYYDIENNFMNPPSPTGYFIYKVIGGAFDRIAELVNQFRIDYSILDCNVGNVEIVKSFPEEPDTNHTYYVHQYNTSTDACFTKYSFVDGEWVSETVTGDVLNSLDVFWGRSYNLPRPLLYEGQKADYLFVDNGTITSHNDNWTIINPSASLTRLNDYSELKRKENASTFAWINKTLSVTDGITIEFDLKQVTIPSSNDQYLSFRDNQGNTKLGISKNYLSLNDGEWHHYKLVVNGLTVTPVIDGVQKSNLTLSDSWWSRIQLEARNNAVHHFKNFKVYTGEEKERPLTDEEYRIYLYLKNHQLLTMKDLLVAFGNAFGSAETSTTLLNSIHTVDHKTYDNPPFSNDSLRAYDDEDMDITTDKLVDKDGVNLINNRLAQGTTSILIPDDGWDEEFLSLLESFISIKGNILISQGG